MNGYIVEHCYIDEYGYIVERPANNHTTAKTILLMKMIEYLAKSFTVAKATV